MSDDDLKCQEELPHPLPNWVFGEEKEDLPPHLPAWAFDDVKDPVADVKISNLEVLRRRFLLRRSLNSVLKPP
jgi:hypothetical protein